MRVLHEQRAAVDVGKDVIAVAVRMPGDGPDGRGTVRRTCKTLYGVLREMTPWLVSPGVSHVAMEPAGSYSMPACHALLEHGDFEKVLVRNARHVKNVPGRKTGLGDAEWLAQLPECGLMTGSFMPPADVRAARDVVRYRKKIARQRVSGASRPGDVPQDAGIRIDPVASSIAARSGIAMIESLIDGERRGQVPAGLAMGKVRSKVPDLPMALEGRPGDHHAVMCRLHLDHIRHLEKALEQLDAQIEKMMQPFQPAVSLLVTVPGVAAPSAWAVISEISASPAGYLPTAAQLASRTGICPGNHEPAGKHCTGKRRHGNKHLQPVLAECAWAAVRHEGYLRSLCHRHVMRNGGYRSRAARNKAIITVAHAILVTTWHILSAGTPYEELGPDYFDRRADPERETRRLIARLEAPGHTVSLTA